jgi:hypothetical protein
MPTRAGAVVACCVLWVPFTGIEGQTEADRGVRSCLAFSASYEFFEWWSALAGGHAADAFLGTQGDVWDTQWDMFSALLGAISAQLLLARIHDRSLAKLLESHPQAVRS